QSTRGGSNETELNELTVKPIGAPSGAAVVTTVTPVAKRPSAVRKKLASKEEAVWGMQATAAERGRSGLSFQGSVGLRAKVGRGTSHPDHSVHSAGDHAAARRVLARIRTRSVRGGIPPSAAAAAVRRHSGRGKFVRGLRVPRG